MYRIMVLSPEYGKYIHIKNQKFVFYSLFYRVCYIYTTCVVLFLSECIKQKIKNW